MRDESLLERILNGYDEPKDLPLALLQDITNDFSQERKIGQGGFGEVYKGVLRNGVVVAVKRIHITADTVDDKLFRREFNSLWKTNHQNVVRFLGFCSNSYHTTIVKPGSEEIKLANVRERLLCFEYINNGSLDKHITDELRGLEWETRYDIIAGICKGLCHLKEKNIIHMDLKPANILLDDHMVPKITDFGLSRPKENSHTTGQRFGTRGYLAPEYDNAGKTSVKSDIYSLGAIIIELVTGSMGVPDKNNVLRRWRHRWSKPPTLLQYQQVTRCIDIAVRCRQQEPGNRPSVSEIISTLTESESMDGQSDQISPRFDEDDMLGIKPLELQLPSELKEEISCFTVELTNDTRSCIAFSIQLPSRQQYSAQPDRGIVQPESKYGVEITVQARDAHEHDHADKFIVQSMKLSDDLRDKVITESMFHEEAGKVVDEVNLMVVYEPTKPQKKFRSREDTNMPAEEVPEAKKRKIVESASGKGKLGSSEEVDAASMDINSSARGKCIKQTEQCNLYPLQSFSRCCPTNMKYLGKESDRAVDVTRGAMGSLLNKLGKLVTEDYNLEKSMKRDIEFFSQELTKIHLDLPKLEKLDGVKIWVNEVREISYNIEDMVDSFVLTHEGLKLWQNDTMTHHEIGDVIKDITNQVQAVLDRQKKYNFSVNNVVADPTAKAPIDPRMAIYINKKQLVGIEARTDELIRLFEEDDGVSKQELKIVSIVGLGGLGKTTLARAVYDKLKVQCHSRAFVSVGQNPDVRKVLMNILITFGNKFNASDLDLEVLIDKLQELLEDKRYFIVIDDIWDSQSWGLVTSAFPRNNHGSRVITTTRIERVARACCEDEWKNVYRMSPLSEEDSRRLFLRRTFGPKKDCTDTPRKEEISIHILKKCGGMPLAINSIASLLAGEQESTWEYVWKSLGAVTESDDLEKMRQILNLSYIHLPDHLKTCLLHVCMYPEDREIDKNDLLRQWVAEGFVHVSRNNFVRINGLDAEEVAEKYFKELINMCLIQPGKIDDYSNEVLSCRVHDIILDLMRSKSSKENFIHVIDGSKDFTGEIRRVSVQYNDEEDTRILETINKGSLSHARSVLLCRSSFVPYFLEFKYVRVLHLEHTYSSRNNHLDLTSITRLFLLRYLKIACIPNYETYELKLPNKIGELRQLETVDIDGGGLKYYPSDVVSLPCLSHLKLAGLVLPDGIGRLESLRTLEGVDVFESSVENIKGLRKLKKLRKLEISSILSSESVEESAMDALHFSIQRLSDSLRVLALKGPLVDVPAVWSSHPLFFPTSRIQELDLGGCRFERCPKWIGQLLGLYKLCIRVREVADGVNIVARLPSLAYFHLTIFGMGEEEKEESVVIPGTGSGGLGSSAVAHHAVWYHPHYSTVQSCGAFSALKHLGFFCKKASLTFEAGAMPKLEKLEILFRHEMAPQFLPVGIQHLPAGTLKKIWLLVDNNNDRQVKGSQVWNAVERLGFLKKCKSKLGPMLKKAFKQHHPGADIDINVGGIDGYIGVDHGEDYEEDDEEDD